MHGCSCMSSGYKYSAPVVSLALKLVSSYVGAKRGPPPPLGGLTAAGGLSWELGQGD